MASSTDPAPDEHAIAYDDSPAKLAGSEIGDPFCVSSHFTGTVCPALTVFHTTSAGVDMSTGWKKPWNVNVELAGVTSSAAVALFPLYAPITVCDPGTVAVHVAPVHEPSGEMLKTVLVVTSPM